MEDEGHGAVDRGRVGEEQGRSLVWLVDLGGTPLAIFSLPLEEIYQDHTCMPVLYMHLSFLSQVSRSWLVCHILYGFLYTYVRRICAQTVFILFAHIYIEYCTYICMLVHCVSIHIESVPYYLLPLLLLHVGLCLCMPHPSVLTPVPTTRYLCPHAKYHFHVCTSGGRSSGVRVFGCSSWHSLSATLTLCSMQ